MCILRMPRLYGGLLFSLVLAGTSPALAQDTCKLSAEVSPAKPILPRVVCEQSPSCATALNEWVAAFSRNEKAAQRLLEVRQQVLEAELKKPAVRDAVAKLLKTRKDLSDALDALGKPADAPALTLASQIDAASRQADTKSLGDLFTTAAGALGPDTLAQYEIRASSLQQFVQSLHGIVSENLVPLAGLTQAAISDLKRLKDEADTASACLKTAEARASKAGVDVTSTRADSLGPYTIRIVRATFGELGKGGPTCDALAYVKRSCEYTEMSVYRETGAPAASTDVSATEKVEKQWRKTVGGRSVCKLDPAVRALCGGGDGPGLLGKQQVRITWKCGPSEQTFCRTWNAGEDVTMICDGSQTYAESASRRC